MINFIFFQFSSSIEYALHQTGIKKVINCPGLKAKLFSHSKSNSYILVVRFLLFINLKFCITFFKISYYFFDYINFIYKIKKT